MLKKTLQDPLSVSHYIFFLNLMHEYKKQMISHLKILQYFNEDNFKGFFLFENCKKKSNLIIINRKTEYSHIWKNHKIIATLSQKLFVNHDTENMGPYVFEKQYHVHRIGLLQFNSNT